MMLHVAAVVLLLTAEGVVAVRSRRYYDILGVEPDSDEATIKKAYKKQALKWHPDRNPNKGAEERFREVAAAYEVLTDPDKRQVYDQFGEEGLKAGGGGGSEGGAGGFHGSFAHGDPFEMFNMFFGGGTGAGSAGGHRRVHINWGSGGNAGGAEDMFIGGGFGGGGAGGGAGARFGGGGRGGGGGGGFGGAQQGSLYEDDPYVQELTPQTFPSDAKWVWLLEFYAPWCGHCQQLASKWKKVAKALKGVVKVAAVNCDEHGELCQRYGVRGYPTIKALLPPASPSGSTSGRKKVEYNGERSASALERWALGLLPNMVTNLRRQADLTAFLQSSHGKASRAEWSAALVLLTNKRDTSPLYKSLAHAYRGKVAFGEARDSNKELAAALGAASYPTLVAVCNGDLASLEVYSGALKSDPLQRFIDGFYAGRKCSAAIPLNAATDFAKLTVGQLKQLLAKHSIPCRGCSEKQDFVAALREHVAAAVPAPAA